MRKTFQQNYPIQTMENTFQTSYPVIREQKRYYIIFILLSFIVFIVTCIINALATTGASGIFNQTTTNVSKLYEVDVTPAGWTFGAVWSTVYIWQALWLIYNLSMIFRHIDDENLYQYPPILTPLFHVFVILNFSANITWLFVWDQEKLGAAYGVLLVLPLSLYGALIISHYNLFKATSILKRNNKVDLWLVRILVHNGLAYYASWVTIAANLNLAIALTYEWKVLDNEKNSLIALGVVAFILLIYFLVDLVFFEKYTRYTWSPYILFIIAFSGVLTELLSNKKYDVSKPTCVFAVVLISIVGFLFLFKIPLTIYRTNRDRRN